MLGGEWTNQKMPAKNNQEPSNFNVMHKKFKKDHTLVLEHKRCIPNSNAVLKTDITNSEQLCNRVQMQTTSQTRDCPALTMFSSSESYRSTPSPDFVLSSSQTSSPLFAGFQQIAPIPKTLVAFSNYFQSHVDAKAPGLTMKTYVDHDYTQSPSPKSVTTLSCRSTSPSLEVETTITADRAPSDSGNSTMPDEINPLCMNDWYRDLLKTEFAPRFQEEMGLIMQSSALQKEQFLTVKMTELPSDIEYNPNKSRLRKIYENPSEAADRERNNLASRRSRFKKKIAQQITNMHLEFDRTENAQLYAIQSWIGNIVFELESKWLESGATSEELYELRHSCGFPQNQPETGQVSELY
ncbi:uncharacterized protein LOC131427448 [Malaya genurostris]|uniref:uncharacterized protein LOC131427448 n=1 Tax=Malaya genurostris TaxID=325434 RepID=UPI0026F3EEFB|nr:uncharacterized protein LOC131427448 [Malaya genurostris]